VGSDGKVLMCSMDDEGERSIGNANFQSIHEIWHGEKMNELRRIHAKKDGFKEINVCRKCHIPRTVEKDEIAKVGNRKIIIENYSNRAQVIGD
jgi:hypothetical protein